MDNKKYTYFAITINAQKESPNPRKELEHIQDLISDNTKSFFATIIHDKDILENGEPKRIHAHVFIELPIKETCKQVLKTVNDYLKINEEQIQIEGSYNPFLMVQYLIHKNNKEKFQYNDFEIITNDQKSLEERLNKIYQTPEQLKAMLLSDLKSCKTLMEFADKHGLEDTNKYRNLFKDIKQEQHLDIKSLNDMLIFYEKLFDQLHQLIIEHKTKDNFIDVKLIENLLYSLDARKSRF